jgi:CRISPR-associated protein Cmr2
MNELSSTTYATITFAPVQGFIESSRKLRDLYGSSYLLSFLAKSICLTVDEPNIISPASPNIIQGLPNVIVINGHLSAENARKCFQAVWSCIANTCQVWIETHVQSSAWNYCWNRSWQAWREHAWEFFYAEYIASPGSSDGAAVQSVRRKLNEVKRGRDWIGINWQGESSTLTGTDAIAHPEMGFVHSPTYPKGQYKQVLNDFYKRLRYALGDQLIKAAGLTIRPEEYEAYCFDYGNVFIDEREELSIPDLIKRLSTHLSVVESLKNKLPGALQPLQLMMQKMEC